MAKLYVSGRQAGQGIPVFGRRLKFEEKSGSSRDLAHIGRLDTAFFAPSC
jgi:hypothetical protein